MPCAYLHAATPLSPSRASQTLVSIPRQGCGASSPSKPDAPVFSGDSIAFHNHDSSPPPSAPAEPQISFAANLGMYGTCKFRGKEAAKYLVKQKLSESILDSASWTKDKATAEKVAAAVLEWAKDHGATMYTHCFQPLGSGMMRLGQMGQVHNAMFNFDRKDGSIKWAFDADVLVHGETDGSSYQNGGMRATHTAGGYTALDPSCAIFIRGDTVHIPTVRPKNHASPKPPTSLQRAARVCRRASRTRCPAGLRVVARRGPRREDAAAALDEGRQ